MKKILLFSVILFSVSFIKCSRQHFTIIVLFENVDAIESGADVRLKGLPVGKVSEMNLFGDNVLVKLNFPNSVNIPENSKFTITNPLVGSSYIDIEPSENKQYLQNLDTIMGLTKKTDSFFDSREDSVSVKKRDAINKIKEGLNEYFDASKDTSHLLK